MTIPEIYKYVTSLEFMWYAVFSQIFILTGLQEIGRAPQNNPNDTLICHDQSEGKSDKQKRNQNEK